MLIGELMFKQYHHEPVHFFINNLFNYNYIQLILRPSAGCQDENKIKTVEIYKKKKKKRIQAGFGMKYNKIK